MSLWKYENTLYYLLSLINSTFLFSCNSIIPLKVFVKNETICRWAQRVCAGCTIGFFVITLWCACPHFEWALAMYLWAVAGELSLCPVRLVIVGAYLKCVTSLPVWSRSLLCLDSKVSLVSSSSLVASPTTSHLGTQGTRSDAPRGQRSHMGHILYLFLVAFMNPDLTWITS